MEGFGWGFLAKGAPWAVLKAQVMAMNVGGEVMSEYDELVKKLLSGKAGMLTCDDAAAAIKRLVKQRDEARENCKYDALNLGAIDAIRTACKEIMGGNASFVDDDFARCLYTQKARAEAAEAEVERLKHDIARHVQIATDLSSEAERLKGVLGKIADTLNRGPDSNQNWDVKALHDLARSALEAKP